MAQNTVQDPVADASRGLGLVALADRCVQCGLCLPHCPTYRLDGHEAESPRGRIAYARAVAAGEFTPTAVGDAHLDHCLGCLRCEQACPAGVDYGALLGLARAAQLQRRPLSAAARVQLALLARPQLLAIGLALYRRLYDLLPRPWRPLPRPPASASATRSAVVAASAKAASEQSPQPEQNLARAKMTVFRGCVSNTYETPTREALARLFAAAGLGIGDAQGQGCCGMAALHAGDQASADRLGAANRIAFADQGRVLCLASGCLVQLRASLAGVAEVEDPLWALDALGDRLAFRDATGTTVAIQLPCTQRGPGDSVEALQRLLAKVPGLQVVVLPDTGCCGAAGLHMLAEPTRAAALRAPLLEAFARSRADQLLSANIGCRLHLGNALTVPVRHPVEFLAEYLA